MEFVAIQDIPVRHTIDASHIRDVAMRYSLKLRLQPLQHIGEVYHALEQLLATREVRMGTFRETHPVDLVNCESAVQFRIVEGKGKRRKEYFSVVGRNSLRFLLGQYGVDKEDSLIGRSVAVYLAGERTSSLYAYCRSSFSAIGIAFPDPQTPLRLKRCRSQPPIAIEPAPLIKEPAPTPPPLSDPCWW